mgnify:CR=1 FL=1
MRRGAVFGLLVLAVLTLFAVPLALTLEPSPVDTLTTIGVSQHPADISVCRTVANLASTYELKAIAYSTLKEGRGLERRAASTVELVLSGHYRAPAKQQLPLPFTRWV